MKKLLMLLPLLLLVSCEINQKRPIKWAEEEFLKFVEVENAYTKETIEMGYDSENDYYYGFFEFATYESIYIGGGASSQLDYQLVRTTYFAGISWDFDFGVAIAPIDYENCTISEDEIIDIDIALVTEANQ